MLEVFGTRGEFEGVYMRAGNFGEYSLLEAISQRRDARDFFSEGFARDFRGAPESYAARNIFCARAAIAFVAAAVKKRSELDALPHVERANSLGSVNFVAGNRESVRADFVYIERKFSGGLHGVAMKPHIGFGSDTSDFGDGLKRADFVVCVHHGDENRLWFYRSAH